MLLLKYTLYYWGKKKKDRRCCRRIGNNPIDKHPSGHEYIYVLVGGRGEKVYEIGSTLGSRRFFFFVPKICGFDTYPSIEDITSSSFVILFILKSPSSFCGYIRTRWNEGGGGNSNGLWHRCAKIKNKKPTDFTVVKSNRIFYTRIKCIFFNFVSSDPGGNEGLATRQRIKYKRIFFKFFFSPIIIV